MSLLRFTVGNYKSIKDPITLDLAPKLGNATSLDTRAKALAAKKDVHYSPRDLIQSVAAIFGPNASGKTNILGALDFAHDVLLNSATTWRNETEHPTVPHLPFALDEESTTQPSFFEFDFTIEGTRYLYGFTHDRRGVVEEWLSYVPNKRWSKGFNRNAQEDGAFDWNESFLSKTSQRELGKVHDRELALSVALRDGHPILGPIAKELVSTFGFISLGDAAKEHRIHQLISLIRKKQFNLDEISLLLQAADTGISSVEVDETRLPKEVLESFERLRRFLATTRSEPEERPGVTPVEDETNGVPSDDQLEDVVYSLRFTHQGQSNKKLRLVDESAGTLAWLSIAPGIVQALRQGKVLIADELDSSLHQYLVSMVIALFADPSINTKGAQLIFTTHNTNVLENMQDLNLEPSAIWFVEKNRYGETDLFSLDDFPRHPKANYERRYLHGLYGSTPALLPSTLRSLVTTEGSHE